MSEYCLVCFTEIIPKIGWAALIAEEKKQTICQTCKEKLIEISGETCQICDRPLNQLEPQYIHEKVCNDCVRWEGDPMWQGALKKNTSLFLYNVFLQEIIAQFKFRGDYALAGIFSETLQKQLQGQVFDYLVPIPLSQERLQERGFNQAEAILLESGLPFTNILTRIHTEKQSKKTRKERIHVEQVFQIKSADIQNKTILLVDDIYTTGSTLRHAAKIVMDHGASTVSSITIAR